MEEIYEEQTKLGGKYSPLQKGDLAHRRGMKSMGSLSGEYLLGQAIGGKRQSEKIMRPPPISQSRARQRYHYLLGFSK